MLATEAWLKSCGKNAQMALGRRTRGADFPVATSARTDVEPRKKKG